MKLVTVDQMRAIERAADMAGLSYAEMMQNAGRGVAEVVRDYFQDDGLNALALVGAGNNGGDALVALTELISHGWHTTACIVLPRPDDDPMLQKYLEAGGKVIDLSLDSLYKQLDVALEDTEVTVPQVLIATAVMLIPLFCKQTSLFAWQL